MALAEHSLTHMLRHSGDVLAEVEHHDVVLRRRDGEDLYLSVRSREFSVREALHVMAILLASLTDDPDVVGRITAAMAASLPWTSFLPDSERRQFLAELARTSSACVELHSYEPLGRLVDSWRATAEIHADPELASLLARQPQGPAVPIPRPR